MSRRIYFAITTGVVAVLAALAIPGYARAAGPNPPTRDDLTVVNEAVDVVGNCLSGTADKHCNVYTGKRFVWLTAGSNGHGLPDGFYFFAVITPGGSPLDAPPATFPKPATDGNLSDDFDPYTNRTFQVKNGEVFSYGGTHDFGVDTTDNNERKIRLFPYSDSPNGVYILAICPLGASGTAYPVDPANCVYDAFKVGADATPPTCAAGVTTNGSGQGVVTITVQDPESGVETISPTSVNATADLPTWSPGTGSALVVTGTQVDTSQAASFSVVVTSVSGQSSTCGAVAPPTDVVPPDQTAPTCVLTATIPGPPKAIEVTVQDAESGISTIATVTTNADVSYHLTPGTTSSVVVTATKIDQTTSAFLKVTVTNGAGQATVCDPLIAAGKARLATNTGGEHVHAAGRGGVTLELDASSVPYGSEKGVTLRGAVGSKQAGQTVFILGHARGFTDASVIATLKTTAGGLFTFQLQPGLNTTFSARWNGAASKTARLTVQPLLSLRRVAAGRYRVDVSTTNGVFLAGHQIVLQRAVGSRWTTIARAKLVKASSETTTTVVSAATFSTHVPGAKLRVLLPPTSSYAGSSARITG